jgi:monoamine oxidase
LTKAGIGKTSFDGTYWKHENGSFAQAGEPVENSEAVLQKLSTLEGDLPVSEFIDRYLQGPQFASSRVSIANYVSGYSAADPARASSFAFRADLESVEQDQYRPKGGYGALMGSRVRQLEKESVPVLLSHPVEHIAWKKGEAKVFANGLCWSGKQVLVTIPLGLLQRETIRFDPALPQIHQAATRLGFGNVIKVVLHFKTAFWEDTARTGGTQLNNLCFLFTEQVFPTWWRGEPSGGPSLTGWLAGSFADPYLDHKDNELIQLAHHSLMRIFNMCEEDFQQNVLHSFVVNWHKDPYSLGAYSYAVPGDAAARDHIRQGVEETIFFAGEALYTGPLLGTVEAALASGAEMAQRMLNG